MIQPFLRRLAPVLISPLLACAISTPDTAPDIEEYSLEVVFPGDGIHGLHGLTFDDQDRLYAGSVVGSTLYRIDPATGRTEVFVASPEGECDDLEFAPDGTLVWTSFVSGKVHSRKGDGPIRVLAEGLPGMNSMAFDSHGRLFATQVFLGDALYEIDLTGESPPRKILEGMGGLNGFDFGPDDRLYGPLWFKGQIVRIDVDAASLEVVADGFRTPAAVNFNSRGELFALDSGLGHVVRIDAVTGTKEIVAHTPTALDNLAINSRDELFVSVFPENAIHQVDLEQGTLRAVRATPLGIPGGLALWRTQDGEQLYIADGFSVRRVDLPDHELSELARSLGSKLESAMGGISASESFLHLTNWAGGGVQRIDRESGEILETLHGFETPADVLELEDGSLIVAQAEPGELIHVDPEGRHRVLAWGLEEPTAIARAERNSVYVALRKSGRIEEIELETGVRHPIASGLEEPEGLAVGPRGRLFVTEAGAARISRIDPESGRREVIASQLPIGFDMRAGLSGPGLPSGIAVTDDGSVYFSADVEAALYRLRPTSAARLDGDG